MLLTTACVVAPNPTHIKTWILSPGSLSEEFDVLSRLFLQHAKPTTLNGIKLRRPWGPLHSLSLKEKKTKAATNCALCGVTLSLCIIIVYTMDRQLPGTVRQEVQEHNTYKVVRSRHRHQRHAAVVGCPT